MNLMMLMILEKLKEIRGKIEKLGEDDRGVGIVEVILILVVLIAIVLLFKNQIMAIIQNAFTSISHDSGNIIN